MPLPQAVISFDLSDYAGADFDARRTKAYATNNVPGGAVIDTDGNKIYLGSGNATVNTDGTGSISVPIPGTGSNPVSWQTSIHVDYPDRNTQRGRTTRTFGPFTITASANLADLVPEQEVPAEYLTQVTAQLDTYVTEAKAARDQAVDISNISTSDGVMAAVQADPTSQFAIDQKATYAATRPLAEQRLTPASGIAWEAKPATNFAPRSIGVDGQLYFTYLNKTALRSGDGLATWTGGPDFTPKGTPNNILWVTRTTAGYVIITNDTPSDTAQVWFCPESAGFSTNLDNWTLVQTTKATTHIAIGKPRIINGVSWLVFGEYVTGVYPSVVRKLWLSKDGGQTWTSIRDSVVNNNAVNSHWHCAVILPSGRIWASQGDGANSFFGYTDDHKNWTPAPLATTDPLYDGASIYQQPTVLLDLGDVLATAPDRGTFDTGVWATDPATGKTVEWAALPSGEVAHTQYGTGSAQRGSEAYVTFPDQGSGSLKTYILGTGDSGRSWHLVSTVDTTGGTAHGPLVGPDLTGKVYLQPTSGTIPTYGTGIMVGTLPTWA